ncbi:MAG TPA: peptide chain release factor N(5)-glutamine methyltransferase [Longimicrobiales bacterium]|nr:peptide chain release factor N(5)-glutamine methyltransferase [Longimicrobiales bacterium]
MERVLELSRKAAGVFEERGFENPRLEAELLLAGVLGMRRLDLYLQHDRPLSPDELDRYRGAVRRRLKHEPLQYVLGTAAFRHLELAVDRRVLIPRPETEVLVGLVLDWAVARPRPKRALDIGTGSGAIALSLAAEGGFDDIVATDISADALSVASVNAGRSGLDGQVEFRRGSLFDAVAGERFTVVVSNPPYIADADRDTLAPEVRDHEPALALFGGATGLDLVRALIEAAPAHLETGGLLALELGLDQGAAVLALLESTGAFSGARIVADLTGRPRFALAERVAL